MTWKKSKKRYNWQMFTHFYIHRHDCDGNFVLLMFYVNCSYSRVKLYSIYLSWLKNRNLVHMYDFLIRDNPRFKYLHHNGKHGSVPALWEIRNKSIFFFLKNGTFNTLSTFYFEHMDLWDLQITALCFFFQFYFNQCADILRTVFVFWS